MLTISPARPDDAASMLLVHRDAILARAASHYPQSTLDAWAIGVTPERVARFKQQIADPSFLILIAEAAGQMIGIAMAVPSRQELRSLYVRPNSIGRVGSALLSQLERQAFEIAGVLICDASLNAAGFYRVHGYIEQGAVEHLLSSGVRVPCLRMQKARPATFPPLPRG